MLNTMVRTVSGPEGLEELGEVHVTDPAQIASIVADAREAQRGWARRSVADRADALDRAADLLAPAAEELARLLAEESGKPLAQARGEIAGAIALLRGNAVEARRLAGRVLPTAGHSGTEWDLAFTQREPLGVVAAILAFNFPAELFVEKCAAALVGGNAVVAKAPPDDPLVVARFHGALIDAGVPCAVVGLLHGGREVGAALAADPGVDAVSLTGSTAAGESVALAGAPTLRRLHLELGGNNACLVLSDADLDLVERELAIGRLMMNGQACSASKRVIVEPAAYDEVLERLRDVASRQVVGRAIDPETTIGPLISLGAAARVSEQVRRARSEGARLVVGTGAADGPWMSPVVLADVPEDAALARDDEVFGPVFAVIRARDAAEAVRLANASSFGLMASVFTADLGRALRLAEQLEAGGVVVNGTDNYRPPVIPFGGVKRSGLGREGLGYTLEELTREKVVVLRRVRADPGGRE